MWKDCEVIEQVKRGTDIQVQVLNRCSVVMATLLMHKSWQRPGAVCNCTLLEYQNAKLVLGEGQRGEDMFVMSVREHKTWVKGAARPCSPQTTYRSWEGYVNHIRPLLDPRKKHNRLLVLDEGSYASNLTLTYNRNLKVRNETRTFVYSQTSLFQVAGTRGC